MKGTQSVHIAGRRADFRFDLQRSITIVTGDSGTGETTLYELVAAFTRLGEASGVTVQCAKRCVALVDIDWKNQLGSIRDSIVFIDEGAEYIVSEEFASVIRGTDNYYVLFTREDLHELPYSIDEIYRIKTSGKRYHTFERVYKPIAGHTYGHKARRPEVAAFDTVLTEDSKAGLQFYESRFNGRGVRCVTAGNNAGVYRWLKDNPESRVFVVADGAAFGSQAARVLKLQEEHASNITVCLPESFEWLILKSRLVSAPDLDDVLENTSAHVDSQVFFSWEQFYTSYLKGISQGTPFEYAKGRLNKVYTVPENARRILAEIAVANIG